MPREHPTKNGPAGQIGRLWRRGLSWAARRMVPKSNRKPGCRYHHTRARGVPAEDTLVDSKEMGELTSRVDWERVNGRKRLRWLVGEDVPHVQQALKDLHATIVVYLHAPGAVYTHYLNELRARIATPLIRRSVCCHGGLYVLYVANIRGNMLESYWHARRMISTFGTLRRNIHRSVVIYTAS